MRKRTVQSVLARRHMFKNGGMVPPQAQPAGILASSPSLVDAVSNDALSDMGGGTLSMAQGGAAVNMQPSYVFNQGGVAKFAPGGVVRVPLNPMIPQPTYSEELLDNRSVVDIAKDRGDFLFKAMQERNRQMEPFKKEGDFLSRMYDKFYAPARLQGERDQARADKEKERQAGMTEIEEMPITVFLSQIGAPDDVIKYYSETGNLPVGYREAFEKAQGGGTIEGYVRASPARGSGKAVATSIALPTDKNIPGESDFDSGMGNAGLTQDYLDEQRLIEEDKLRQGYLGSDYIAGMGAVGKNGPLQDQEAGVADDIDESGFYGDSIPAEGPSPQSVVSGTESVKKETDMKGILPPKIKPSAPEKPVDPSAVSEEASKTIQQVKSAAESGDSEEVKKGIEEYAAEFKAAMPEYEGKSQYESGMDFVKMGMAIAAGQSPNAIENISKGVLGTIDNFTGDEKEKRLYKRQVNLSAAKYGLQSVRSDDVFNRKIKQEIGKEERAMKQFIVSKPFTENGVKYEKGSLYQTTVGNMKSDDFTKTLPNLTTTGIWGKMLDKKADLLASLNKRNLPQMIGSGKGSPNAQSVNDQLTKYGNEIKNLRNSAMMMTMLDKSIITNAQGKVTGFSSFASRTLNKLASSANMKGELKILDTISNKRGKDSREFQYQQQVIANMMLKEILGEGSKNVSNIDRDLAQQIVGLMNEWDSIFANKDLLHSRMQNIRSQVNGGIENGFDRLSNTEFVLQNTVNRADQFATDRLTSMRSRLGSVKRFTNPERKGAVKFSDYFDFKTNKLKRKLPR